MESAGQRMESPLHNYGIDFSGDKDAGKKIWIAKGKNFLSKIALRQEKCIYQESIRAETAWWVV